eukprot:COSAG02_NODE_15581_length_1158_cov_1.499528_1_plen_20_part_10
MDYRSVVSHLSPVNSYIYLG